MFKIDSFNKDEFVESNYDLTKLELICKLKREFFCFTVQFKIGDDEVYVNNAVYLQSNKNNECLIALDDFFNDCQEKQNLSEKKAISLKYQVLNYCRKFGSPLLSVCQSYDLRKMFENDINKTIEFIEDKVNFVITQDTANSLETESTLDNITK